MNITVDICTRDRYHLLSHCLLSIAMQTYKPLEIIIIDDSLPAMDMRNIPLYQYIFQLLNDKGIGLYVEYGQNKGQHFGHQRIQEIAKGDWIFRIDDDEIAEPTCLERLIWWVEHKKAKIGAVAPLVLMPNSEPLKAPFINSILKLDQPNVQWFNDSLEGHFPAFPEGHDHLYSCFLYKKGITQYELNLSPVAHREETIFTYKIKRAGRVLSVQHDAIVHHFRSETGGIRSHKDQSYYDHDEGVFKSLLSLWNVDPAATKICVLDSGIGDHYAFKHILPALLQKHGKVKIACCFNEVFWDDENIELISIAEAYNMFHGCIDEFNIYRKMIDWNWKPEDGNLVSAFRKLYL